VTAILDEAVVSPPEPAAAQDEMPTMAGGVGFMSPVEADEWLRTFDEPSSTGLLIVPATETNDAADDEPLVIDVDEGPGGGPMTIGAATALPPLVIDPIHDVPTDDGAAPLPGTAIPEPPSGAPVDAAPQPAAELRFCTNCGATLRPGRRFCHRCGASVAEMVAELFPAAPAPQPADDRPAPRPTIPREEWPTIVSDSLPYLAAAGTSAAPGAMARFCNNCGLGLAADATICPDCGSRDIS
jgi:RNA polymerase subunit RPABC4/transcription elongation factor Spt4